MEHLLLAAVAAVAGIAIGGGALLSMDTISLQELPRAQDIELDRVVVLYTLAAAVAIGLLLGLIPVAATMSANVIGVLREEGRSATSGRGAQSFRRGLVVAQVASAFVLLVAGRFFNERDAATAPRVIIVDDRLARRFWPDQNPLGRRMSRPSDDGDSPAAITEQTEFLTVVGVVAEMKLRSLTDGDNRVGAYFIPLAQEPQSDLTFVLRTDGDPTRLSSALWREVAALDPQLPVFEMRPMSYWTERSLASRRSPALLSVAFGFVALFLSAIGIYGVLAYLVTQRTKEIGIRVAFGSSASAVFKLVLREGVLLVGLGLLVGGLGSLMLRSALASQLYGGTASNPVVLLLVTGMLTVVAFTSCAVPARRATKIDPLIALND